MTKSILQSFQNAADRARRHDGGNLSCPRKGVLPQGAEVLGHLPISLQYQHGVLAAYAEEAKKTELLAREALAKLKMARMVFSEAILSELGIDGKEHENLMIGPNWTVYSSEADPAEEMFAKMMGGEDGDPAEILERLFAGNGRFAAEFRRRHAA